MSFGEVTTQASALAIDCAVQAGLLSSQSQFYAHCVRRTARALIKMRYNVLAEMAPDPEQWLAEAAAPIAYAVLVDLVADEALPDKREIRASYSAMTILAHFVQVLNRRYETRLSSTFFEYLGEHSRYAIAEWKWTDPATFSLRYGSVGAYISKQKLYRFPVEILARSSADVSTLRDAYDAYYAFMLLADDVGDLSDDVDARCLNYIIAKFWSLNNDYPANCSWNDAVALVREELDALRTRILALRQCGSEFGKVGEALWEEVESTSRILLRGPRHE